jgi:hypothetical protein
MTLSVKKDTKLGEVIKILGNTYADHKKEMFIVNNKM